VPAKESKTSISSTKPSPTDRPLVLIAGATGYLGRFVAREAAARGLRVRALARSPSTLDDLADELEQVVTAEATHAESLVGICDRVDVVFSSLGITRQTDRVTYDAVDYQANLNLLHEALASGCRRFVFVAVLYPEYTIHTDRVAARERFVTALQASSIEAVIICPTGFFADMAEFLRMAKSGRCYVLGDGCARLNPIHGADLAGVCVDHFFGALGDVEVGGPDALNQRQISAMAFAALGRPAKITAIPFWMVDALLWLLKWVHRRWWNIGAFIAAAGRRDMVAPCAGNRHLKTWFEQQSEPAPGAPEDP
jgi:uncharacterized protein YbjT (DUF2867 family)